MFSKRLKIMLVASCAALTIPAAAQAQWWQHHPKYLHAMSDLRMAYWLIAHRERMDLPARDEERHAMIEIRRAYQDLKDAAIVDEKDIDAQPPADTNFYDHRGRLHRAHDYLAEAKDYVQGEEDDPEARGLRQRALHDINVAIQWTDDAIRAWRY